MSTSCAWLRSVVFVAVTVFLMSATCSLAAAQAGSEQALDQAYAQLRQARLTLRLEQGRRRSAARQVPSLVVYAGMGAQLGEWRIQDAENAFGSAGPELGLMYRQFLNKNVGISIGMAGGRSRMSLMQGEGSHIFGRTDLSAEAALHLCPSAGSRFYFGPTVRAGYWILARDELWFTPDDEKWGSSSERVAIGNAWVVTGGPHFGWLLGKRDSFDLSMQAHAGAWHESSRWRLTGAVFGRLGYVFALGRAASR